MITERAKAKINLYLDVTGKRHDGYHALCSFVMFADVADEIIICPSCEFRVSVQGPFAQSLAHENAEDNLVARAARQFTALYERDINFEIIVVKNLPVGAGIGGGSADAAATLRALIRYWNIKSSHNCDDLMANLGADVPMCFRQTPQHVGGIGEILTPLSFGFNIPCLLVYPQQHVATNDIFKALDWNEQTGQDNQPLKNISSDIGNLEGLISLLRDKKNDLAPVAVSLYPVIGEVLSALHGLRTARLVNMSGSGSCCFALFRTMEQCEKAARDLKAKYPGWWICATQLSGT